MRGYGVAWPELNQVPVETRQLPKKITGRNVLVRELMLHPTEPAKRMHLDGILSGLPGKVANRSTNTDEYAVTAHGDSVRKIAADEYWRQLKDTDKEWFLQRNDYTDYVETRARQNAMRGGDK